ncbi:MAG: DUF3822 family protein [Vicingaceae bacterium]
MVSASTSTENHSPSQQLLDQSYASRLDQLKLNLQVSKNYLFASHFDPANRQYVSLEEYYLGNHDSWYMMQENAATILKKLGASNGNTTASVNLIDHNYALVPLALLDENKLATYLNFNSLAHQDEQLIYQFDILESQQAAIVYGIPLSVNRMLESQLSNYNWSHFAFPLLESILLSSTQEATLYLHIQYNRFDVVYVDNKKLKFFNSFNYQTVEDLIYFLLYVMEQLNLDRESIPVELIGEFDEQSAIYEMLFKYIRKVSIGKRPQAVNYSQVLSSLPQQHYYTLFNQYLCE